MNFTDLSEKYPEIYDLAENVLRENLPIQNFSDLEDVHSKIFSRILSEGYFELLSEYRLHLVIDSRTLLIVVVFIPVKGNNLSSILYT